MAFIEERLLDRVAYGFNFGPERNTRIHRLRSGHTVRNANWPLSLWRGSAPYVRLDPDTYALILGAFERADGMTHGFRFRNWMDFSAVGESLGAAPAGTTAVQLRKTYPVFGGSGVSKTIKKPVTGTVTVYQDGIAKSGTIDTTTGLFTPSTAWTEGLALTADFEFDYGVCFAQDWLPFDYETVQALTGEVGVQEIYL